MQNMDQAYEDIRENIVRAYTKVAASFSEVTDKRQATGDLDELLGYWSGPPGSVVDLGCGTGKDVEYFQSKGWEATGVDLCPAMLEAAGAAYQDCNFLVGDMTEHDTGPVDIVYSNSAIDHLPADRRAMLLARIAGSLSPGGLLYVKARENKTDTVVTSEEYGDPITRFYGALDEATFNAELEAAGFEIIRSETYGPDYSGIPGKKVKNKFRVFARKVAPT